MSVTVNTSDLLAIAGKVAEGTNGTIRDTDEQIVGFMVTALTTGFVTNDEGDEVEVKGTGWTGLHKAYRDFGGHASGKRFQRLYLALIASAAAAAAEADEDDEGDDDDEGE